MSDQPRPFKCLLCGDQRCTAEILGATDRYLGYPGNYDYVRCVGCRLVQQHPIPADTAPFYQAYPVHRRRSFFYRLARKLLMPGVYLSETHIEGKRVLDFGCGNGDFLLSLRDRGAIAEGYEFNSELAAAIASLTGIPVSSDLEHLSADRAGEFDFVTMHCVLEHLNDPQQVLARVAQLLKAGGRLYVVVPHFDCWERRLFGRYWHALDPPRHLMFPDDSHIRAFAEPHGMVLERAQNVRFPNNLTGSISAAVTGKARPGAMLLLSPLAWVLQWLHPTGTRAFVLVRHVNQRRVATNTSTIGT